MLKAVDILFSGGVICFISSLVSRRTHTLYSKCFQYLFLWYITLKVCSGAAYSVSRGTITCPIYCTLVLCCRERKRAREMGSKRGEREMSGVEKSEAGGRALNEGENEVI